MSDNEEKKPFVGRVTQLDTIELDEGIQGIFKEKLVSSIRLLSPSLVTSWEPEIDAAIYFIIWKLSVQKTDATFGQQLLRTKLSGFSTNNKKLLLLLPAFLQYFDARMKGLLFRSRNPVLKEQISRLLSLAEITISVASMLNLLHFLNGGKYPSLLFRLLNLEVTYQGKHGKYRPVGYSHMTRELLWHSFIELLMFVLPLINYHFMKRKLLELMSWGTLHQSSRIKKQPTLSLRTRCGICSNRPVLPHQIGCSHIFCFYCAQASVQADPQFACPLCGCHATGTSSVQPIQVIKKSPK